MLLRDRACVKMSPPPPPPPPSHFSMGGEHFWRSINNDMLTLNQLVLMRSFTRTSQLNGCISPNTPDLSPLMVKSLKYSLKKFVKSCSRFPVYPTSPYIQLAR